MRSRQKNLLSEDERERLRKEREARNNPYISEEWYNGSYASRKMITGPWSKYGLSVMANHGNAEAEETLRQILEAEKILWKKH